ncbi:MAG: site-specific tyrosine recombinase XerC [Polyangiaceae bacterium]
MRVRHYSPRTLVTWQVIVTMFLTWCEARGVTRPAEVTRPILERYQRHLYLHRKANGKPLSFGTQKSRMIPIKSFFKWLTRQNVILSNPASELDLPRPERRLPRHVLSADEAERVLAQADVSDALGVRDRAILETLYSTGIRRMEVISLKLFDVDAERGTLSVRQGKGTKDRMVPIGERALAWVAKYLSEVRPELVFGPDEGTVFLTNAGEPLVPGYLTHRVKEYVDAAELGKRGSCHLFRHTMATVMLENGADVRFIQEMLGHANLNTTEIYTRVSIRKLKEIHAATHPSAKLKRMHNADTISLVSAENDGKN